MLDKIISTEDSEPEYLETIIIQGINKEIHEFFEDDILIRFQEERRLTNDSGSRNRVQEQKKNPDVVQSLGSRRSDDINMPEFPHFPQVDKLPNINEADFKIVSSSVEDEDYPRKLLSKIAHLVSQSWSK